jgi:ComF family protein
MRLWTWTKDLLFPAKCPFCHDLLEDSAAPVCPACRKTLPWLTGTATERRVDFAQGCISPLGYRGQVPEAIHRYKFSGVRAYGAPFGALVAQCVREHPALEADLVTWTPLSRRRLRERGFNQAELMAREVGKQLSLPAVPTLCKTRHTGPQSDLKEAPERRANALNAYDSLPTCEITGKRLLLVDDVVTSGATLSECARVLCQAGAGSVWCATLAQAREK